MLRTLAITKDLQLIRDIPLNQLNEESVKWFWVDFDTPTETEAELLRTHFHFHPLAIEDCLHLLQRPKLDHYGSFEFFVLHGLHPETKEAEEVDLFVGPNFVVTVHLQPSREVDEAWYRMATDSSLAKKNHVYVAYMVMDKLVDNYFPSLYEIEDQLNDIATNTREESIQASMDKIFELRSGLHKIRRTVVPMRDLLYRIINSEKIDNAFKEHIMYFTDIHDHLLKLSEMIDSNREVSADLRDSYISLSSNRMNAIMKTLTVMTSVFIPLTFIASIYGMNFEHMPELGWRWGYFGVLTIMVIVGTTMVFWLWRKGWFE